MLPSLPEPQALRNLKSINTILSNCNLNDVRLKHFSFDFQKKCWKLCKNAMISLSLISKHWVDGFQISQSLWVRKACWHILNLKVIYQDLCMAWTHSPSSCKVSWFLIHLSHSQCILFMLHYAKTKQIQQNGSLLQWLEYESTIFDLFWEFLWHKSLVCMNCETHLGSEYAPKSAWTTGFEKSEIHQHNLE